jgi:hypothetical protein
VRDKVHTPRTATVCHAEVFLFADGEINFDRADLRDGGEDRGRPHQVADLHSVDTGDSVDQRNNFGIAKVYAGLLDCRLVCLDGCIRRTERLRVGVELTLRNCMRLGLRNVAFHVNFGVGHPRLGLSQFGLWLDPARLEMDADQIRKGLGPFGQRLLRDSPDESGSRLLEARSAR